MKFYKRNAIAVGVLFLVSAFLGMYLGATQFDLRFTDAFENHYMIKKGEAMMRAAHTHGMPFALYNLLLAFVIPYLGCTEKMKIVLSWSGILMIIMPVALFLRGYVYPETTFDLVGFVGAFFFVLTSFLVLVGAIRYKEN